MLALAEVQQGHDGGLFVLGGVSLEDLGDELLVLGVELEGDVGVVVGRVSVLRANSRSAVLHEHDCCCLHCIALHCITDLLVQPPVAKRYRKHHWQYDSGYMYSNMAEERLLLLTTWRVSLGRLAVMENARI